MVEHFFNHIWISHHHSKPMREIGDVAPLYLPDRNVNSKNGQLAKNYHYYYHYLDLFLFFILLYFS